MNIFGNGPRPAAKASVVDQRFGSTAEGPQMPQEGPTGNGGTNTYRIGKARLDAKQARDSYIKKLGKKEQLEQERDEAVTKHAEAQKKIGNLELVQVLLQKTSDYARQQAKTQIEEVVSEALNVVFGGQNRFEIDLVVRSDRPEADYYLDGRKLEKPDYGRGGGKIDVITLALRLAILEIRQQPGIIFLDEIGKHVDRTAVVNVAYFLREYSRKFNRQIILITHNDVLADIADVGVKVGKKNERAFVKSYLDYDEEPEEKGA